MSGANFMDELDCGSFFDHIDDFIEFPADDETGLNMINCNEFPSIWTDNSDTLPCSDPIFSGSNSNSASDLSAELAVPYEDIVQLEWLSNFVEDSFADGGLTINKGAYPFKESAVARNQFQSSSPVSVLESSSSSCSSSCSGGKVMPLSPTRRGTQRARSKRPRPPTFNPRPAIQLISPTEAPEPVLIPVPVVSSGSENFVESHSIKTIPKLAGPEHKKKKKLKMSVPLGNVEVNQNQSPASQQGVRKCLHCEITKTPQWRAGPMGPKTLCNACGVRYKSGRLFPEYRPAASPTFVPSIHSNSHKKVVEMRTKGTENVTMIENVQPETQFISNSKATMDYL